jgi:hypothetical protein
MSISLTRALSLALFVSAPLPALAQSLPTSQPPYLLVIREDVKTGRGAEHVRIESGWPAAFERAKSPDYYLAMESMTSNEAWFVIPFASYGAMAEMQARERGPALGPELDRLRRADAEVIDSWRAIELRARPELSAGAYPDIGKQRHWEVTMFRMRPGGDAAFTAIAKAYGAAGQKAGRTMGFRVYEVSAGMPSPTYFVFSSVTGFGEFDKLQSEDEATLKAMLGDSPDPSSSLLKNWNDRLINAETFRLTLSPEMSYVPKDVKAADPAFWMPKKAATPKAAPAPAKPTAGTQP